MNDEIMKNRLECLQMAFDFNFKINNIKSCYENEKDIMNDLQDVFYLAEMNFNYIAYGKIPSNESESNEIKYS